MIDLEHLARNVEYWGQEAPSYFDAGRRNWSRNPSWGIWGIPESDVHLLPPLEGKDVLDAGCGTGYLSAWVARLGGKPIGLDPTPEQLTNARRFQDEFDIHFPLVRGAAEMMPFSDGSFDVVLSEYGAAIWADPFLWIPEAARVLRTGGELVFLRNADLLMLCLQELEVDDPADDTLRRPYFDIYQFEWPDNESVEFHLGHGDMIRLLRANGFEVQDLVELRPADGQSTTAPYVTKEWAQKWPTEEVWKARLRT